MWPVHSAVRREREMCCSKFCLSSLSNRGDRERRLVMSSFEFEWVSPGAHVISFAVRGFVTHWLQAPGSSSGSDRVLIIPPSQAVKQRSCESCLYHHCVQKNKKIEVFFKKGTAWTDTACGLHAKLQPALLVKRILVKRLQLLKMSNEMLLIGIFIRIHLNSLLNQSLTI